MKYLYNDFSFNGEIHAYVFSDFDKDLHIFDSAKKAYKAFNASERADRFPRWLMKPTAPKYVLTEDRRNGCATHYMMQYIKHQPKETQAKYFNFCADRANRIYKAVDGNERLYYNVIYQLVSGDYAAD